MQENVINKIVLGACLIVGMISATVLAWHYDGTAVSQTFDFFTNVLTVLGGSMGLHSIVSAVMVAKYPPQAPPPTPVAAPSNDSEGASGVPANTPDGQANAPDSMPGI